MLKCKYLKKNVELYICDLLGISDSYLYIYIFLFVQRVKGTSYLDSMENVLSIQLLHIR